MSLTPPFRNRPNLHLALTAKTVSPALSRNSSSSTTPFNTTTYSPYRSAALKPPTPYKETARFLPRRIRNRYGGHASHRARRIISSRALWFAVTVCGLLWWWIIAGREELEMARFQSSDLGKEIFGPEITRGLQFFPATNPKIHYVGRWTATPNRLRMDGTFAGVYFDVTVNATSTILLALHNTERPFASSGNAASTSMDARSKAVDPALLSFHPSLEQHKPAPPISLLARVDQEEYVLSPSASGLVSLRHQDLEVQGPHEVRVIAPMNDDGGRGIVEFEGLWLDKGGKLLRVEGTQLAQDVEEEDEFHAENDNVGKKHRLGLHQLLSLHGEPIVPTKETTPDTEDEPTSDERLTGDRKKLIEIITDTPGFMSRGKKMGRTGGGDGILGGVMGWEYLLGEMFGIDHVSIGLDGMCLTHGCIGGTGEPVGIGDVFFRSGPLGTPYFSNSWMFHRDVPDVMVFHVGGSDSTSFEKHAEEYNMTSWELSARFEDTYVSLIKATRQLAYSEQPGAMTASPAKSSGFVGDAASVPIFVMRPLRGQLEHATQSVVDRLRKDGDKSVFWLDTSGWLDCDGTSQGEEDFYHDESVDPARWRLTERGNQRVAIFLHMHVCRYLAQDTDRCAFLPPEVYHGKVFDPDTANFDRYIENEKERKLKKIFWEDQ
ncbi:MAG: hypothetical protein M1817_001182 [Caeruleum heppii]|nr:MAG: hypothetical protein M1817_001182 [Caeruleum heppii]